MSFPYLEHIAGQLHLEQVALADIAASLGSPTYVYSRAAICDQIAAFKQAFTGTALKLHYAVKANSNLHLLKLCYEQGCGFDIVSAGELLRVVTATGDASHVIFSGVGKTVEEIDLALKLGIACFNIESDAEYHRIVARAKNLQTIAPISIRVNPDVDAQTHPYISTGLKENKFGVPIALAEQIYLQANKEPAVKIVGIDCHIGSQIAQSEPMLEALVKLLEMVDALGHQGISFEHLDLGGGMGITYRNETTFDIGEYGAQVQQIVGSRDLQLYLEPGRSIVGNAGVLLTHVEYTKPSADNSAPNFAIVDAGMNDLIRPSLYQAWHDIVEVTQNQEVSTKLWDVVGPVCESGDFLGKQRELSVQEGDVLAVLSAGAYGFVQASNYNSRGRACEVLVDGDQFEVIRRRETFEDQVHLERVGSFAHE